MATFADLLSFVSPSTRFVVDNTAEPEAPPPLTQRGPGEYFPPGVDLISACHDSSLVDRVLSALGRGFDKDGKLDLALPLDIDSGAVWGSIVIYSVEIALGRLCLMALQGVSLLKMTGDERLNLQESTANDKHLPLSVASCEYYLFRVPPDDGAPPASPGPTKHEGRFTPVVIHGYKASDLKTYYDGLTNASGVERPGLGAQLLDIRIVNATGELVRLEGARAIAAKVGLTSTGEAARIALHATLRGDRRFAIILALPYFVVTELGRYNFLRPFAGQAKLADRVASLTLLPLVVVIDGKRHLLISDLCSAVVEPEHSTAKPKSLMGVLLGTLMNDFDDYRVEGHSSEVEQRIRDYVKQLDELTVVHEVQPTDDVPRDSTVDNSPPAQTSTAPSDEAAASSSIRRPDDTSDSSEELKAFVGQDNQTVMARHFPNQAIVCDVKELPDSRMVAIPIELEVDTAPALSPQPPAKKIRLDSDAPRPKLAETLPLAIQELFSPDAFFSKAEGTFSSPLASALTSRLDLVRRVGRGASSSVWQAEWLHHSAGSACPSPSASTGKSSSTTSASTGTSSFTTSANPSTPTPSPETTPNTSPRSLLDVRNTPDSSPIPDLPSAMSGLSSTGMGGRGKLVAKVVREQFTPSIAREYFVYTSIVPLLSVKAQEYFPAFYGLYRSGNEGQTYVLLMEDAGSPITEAQLKSDAKLKAKVDYALKLIAEEGLHHNDEGARNVLLRPDGRICLIDWGQAQVK